jgi:hypothetical protein
MEIFPKIYDKNHDNLLLFLFSYWTLLVCYSQLGYTSYIFCFFLFIYFINKIKIPIFFPPYISLLLLLFTCKLLLVSPIVDLKLIKYFFGFLVFYLLLRTKDTSFWPTPATLLISLSLLTIVECILINSISDVSLWPNYPNIMDKAHIHTHMTAYFGFLQRPYSFGGNASMTSTMLVALFPLLKNEQNQKKGIIALLLGTISVLISFSGLGVLLLITHFVFLKKYSFRFIISCFAAYFLFFYMVDVNFASPLMRVSPQYFLSLVGVKWLQFDNQYGITSQLALETVFGHIFHSDLEIPFWDDFGWGSFLYSNGVLGVLIYLLFALIHLNKQNWKSIFIMFIGAFHYGAIFTIPGQLIYSYLLTYKNTLDKSSTMIGQES